MSVFSRGAHDYFAAHGATGDYAARVGVGEEAGCIVFPTRDLSGDPLPRRRRLDPADDGPKFSQPRGRSPATWWPEGRPDRAKAVLVVEGEPDALAAACAMADAPEAVRMPVVGVPGAGFPLRRLVGDLVACGTAVAVLAVDADAAGARLAQAARTELAEHGIAVAQVELSEGHDLGDVLAGVEDRSAWLAHSVTDAMIAAEAESTCGDAPDDEAEPPALAFASPAELRAATPAHPPWLWTGYIARGAITLLAGKPKVGKSTLAFAVVEAVASRAPTFLGRAVAGGGAVYVSEEGAATLAGKLPADEGVRVLTREGAWPKPSWAALVTGAVAEALRVGAMLLVIDTFTGWAELRGDAEKDAGHVQAAMAPLVEAARAGLAVLLVHHQRKAGGESGDAIRGSSALAGAADILVEYERPSGDVPPRQRQLVAVGRWPQTPALVLLDYEEAGVWRVIGEGASREEAAQLAWREALLRALPADGGDATVDELQRLLDEDRRKWHRELSALVEGGAVECFGRGVKGDPKRYRLSAPDSVQGFRPEARTESVNSGSEAIPSVPSRPRRGRQDGISLAGTPAASTPAREDGIAGTEADEVRGETLEELEAEGFPVGEELRSEEAAG
ncbi:MAG: AAA family ATPase [Solirubrobacteraceae bacterium]